MRVFWNLKILKNPSCHQMWDFRYCKWNFQGFQIFKNFYLKYFQKWEAVFQNKKKIRLDKYFVILSWKCAPVCKIKSFTVTSGLRISKFRTFYFIKFSNCTTFLSHCNKTKILKHDLKVFCEFWFWQKPVSEISIGCTFFIRSKLLM